MPDGVRLKSKKGRDLFPNKYLGSWLKLPLGNNYSPQPIMAFRSTNCWKSMVSRMRGNATFATATSQKMKAYAPAADHRGNPQQEKSNKKILKADFVPVYVVLGMIAVSLSLGVYTLNHQLFRAPNVRVKKKSRETIPELEEPEKVVDEADKFLKKSFFRKVAHVQEFNTEPKNIPDPIRKDVYAQDKPRVDTLKSSGV